MKLGRYFPRKVFRGFPGPPCNGKSRKRAAEQRRLRSSIAQEKSKGSLGVARDTGRIFLSLLPQSLKFVESFILQRTNGDNLAEDSLRTGIIERKMLGVIEIF